MSKPNDREFFVGYLSMPKKLNAFYKVLIAGLLLIAITVAVWLSSAQQSVGKASWDIFEPITLEGNITVAPYPILHIAGPEKSSVILVQLGKHSASPAAQIYAGKRVSVTGIPIKRGDWKMLEIKGESSITELGESTSSENIVNDVTSLGSITLRGEIIDSKCYLGVMKPGAGLVHRACAALCLKGGLPPMLLVKDKNSQLEGMLITHADRSSASKALAIHAAVPIELSGELEQRGGLLYLRMNEDAPRQLTSHERKDFGKTITMNLQEEYAMCHH